VNNVQNARKPRGVAKEKVMKLSLKVVITSGLLALGGLSLAVGGTGWFSMSGMGSVIEAATENTIPSLVIVSDMQSAGLKAASILGEAVITTDGVARKAYLREYDERVAAFDEGLAAYEPLILNSDDQQHFDRVAKAWTAWHRTADEVQANLEAGNISAATALVMGQEAAEGDEVVAALDDLSDFNADLGLANKSVGDSVIQQGEIITIALLILSLGMTVGVLILVSRRVLSPLAGITRSMQTISDGDLDSEVPAQGRTDEVGEMAKAVEVFRQNGLRMRDMTEQERQAQIVRQARMEMMQQLQQGVGSVVSAALEGDFGQRVTAHFDDAELEAVANGINSLVETVDAGLQDTGSVLAALADTDLTHRMTGTYKGAFAKLRDNVNAVADNLGVVVTQLRTTSTALKLATGEILAGANDLSQRTTKQAATIEETSAAMEQLSSTVKANASDAGDASEKALIASRAAEEGGEVMRNATSAMERISASSVKISNIIGLIDDIAFQTNLLALNASVEAARAGEAGKGFAVVAVEVRRLAQSAANASAEVKALIQQSSDEVRSGSTLVDQAASRLVQMLELVRESARSMESIARASGEQATAISEINTAVREMDEITQHNAALVEETNAAIEQTEAQANELDRIVATFRTNGAAADDSAKRVSRLVPQTKQVAKRYLTRGNAAIATDWSEF
jgi:methyl-accepting chemotaxis protein